MSAADYNSPKYKKLHENVKKNVEQSREYFKENVDRYNTFRIFVFESALTNNDRALLAALKKPQIEFPIIEAYISRLRGEFSKQEPSIEVEAQDGIKVQSDVVDIVEGRIKAILEDADRDNFKYHVYTDLLSGGFSAAKVWTEYKHSRSWDQVIRVGRVFDPTLVGFDPMARSPHKGDGRYCYELFPLTRDEFSEQYPNADISKVKFTRAENNGFSWSYNANKEDIVLICDYYERKKKKVKILKLSTGHTITQKQYNELQEEWKQKQILLQFPTVRGQRWEEDDTIVRTLFIENQILARYEIDYDYLPIVYFDGNSIELNKDGNRKQMTRPYGYNAIGTQRLKNFAGQTLANELENMTQHKWIASKESIPSDSSADAYADPQQSQLLLYNEFSEDNPDVRLTPPREVNRIPTPPEVINSFNLTDSTTQTILGSYDASLGINNNQLSGVAIQEGATQSNAAAMPYVNGFLNGLNQVAQIIVDLIPKYEITPTTIPIINADGKREYKEVNNPNNNTPMLNYQKNALGVNVYAGPNFAIEKRRALNSIISLMQASPLFAEFMNKEGLGVLIGNLDILGIDKLKELATNFMEQLQQQAAQQQQQPTPEQLQQQNMEIQQQEMQLKAQDLMERKQDNQREFVAKMQKNENDRLKIELTASQQNDKNVLEQTKATSEIFNDKTELALKHADQEHRHANETIQTINSLLQQQRQKTHEEEDDYA